MVGYEEIQALVEENERRKDEIFGPYNPVTGEGCYDFEHRVHLHIEDFVFPDMFVPAECMDTLLYRALVKYGSVKSFIEDYWRKEYTEELHNAVTQEICKVRFREDPEFAMYMTDKIEDKHSGEMIPFRLNYPQRRLITLFEQLRHEKKPILVVILKARQWGGSTLTQMYIKWMQDFRHDGWHALILAQVKGTSKKIKSMYRKAVDHQAGWTIGYGGVQLQLAPFENSTDDFILSDGIRALRRSTLSITSFENYDSVRGSNFHCVHYSEVAYWKKTEEHDPEAVVSSVSGGVKRIPDNIEVYESTGRGAAGFFYDKCQDAMNNKTNSAYSFIFIPFYFIEHDMEDVDDEEEFARWLLENKDRSTCPEGYREEGKFFWKIWKLGATFQAINWYRNERNKYHTHAYMATEAPIDEVEAFRNSGNLVFDQYAIDELKSMYVKEPMHYGTIVLPNAARRNKQYIRDSKIVLGMDGELKIWQLPNNNILKIKNRYLVSVDIGGNSTGADYTVMTVIDRKGMLMKDIGAPEVVARWRGHCRHDILAWKAAALAHYYGDALLVIESNTADRERSNNTEGDHFGTIIEEIADYYPNIYQRSKGPEAVDERPTMKFGFQTNKLTKGWIIDNLIACVEDKLWIEPDKEMFRELRTYERKDDGSLGNIEGNNNHDDILMSTAIGLWVALNDMDPVAWITKSETRVNTRPMTEATF